MKSEGDQPHDVKATSGLSLKQSPPIPVLIVLPPSHYCERARWGLDYCGKPYAEIRWAIGVHAFLAKRAGSKGTATPMLDLGNGELIEGSGAILYWAGLPTGDHDLERRFEECIGPLVRRVIYAATLGEKHSHILDVLLDGVPAWHSATVSLGWPLLKRMMRAGLQAERHRLPTLLREMECELHWFADVLKERGRHLNGGGFGRSDITAASLLAPLARPEASPLQSLHKKVVYAAPLEKALKEWNESVAFRWVKATYSESRWARKIIESNP